MEYNEETSGVKTFIRVLKYGTLFAIIFFSFSSALFFYTRQTCFNDLQLYHIVDGFDEQAHRSLYRSGDLPNSCLRDGADVLSSSLGVAMVPAIIVFSATLLMTNGISRKR